MNTQHPYMLRAYHNPENIDGSRVPKGWRFRYADEMRIKPKSQCRMWMPQSERFGKSLDCSGMVLNWTYIVPVES